MATSSRSTNSVGSALRGQGTWADSGQGGQIITKTPVSVGAGGNDETVIYQAPIANTIIASSATTSVGYGAFDAPPPAGAPIWGCYAIWITAGATSLAANLASLQIVANLWRAGAVVGGGPLAGWASATNPLIGIFSIVQMPFAVGGSTLTANTAVATGPGGTVGTTGLIGTCWVPLQQQDIITIKVLNSSGGSLPINVFTASTTVI